MEVVVLGAGSLGSLVGALLARTHDVTLVGRDPHVAAVSERGLTVHGIETFEVAPSATTNVADISGGLAVVAVKSFDTDAAGQDLATGSFDAVLSLQNGMGNEDTLASHLDSPVLAGTTTLGARLVEPGAVEWTGAGEVVLGPWTADVDCARSAGDTLRAAGIRTRVESGPAMRDRLWQKLAVNAAINPTTALAGIENGAVFAGPTAEIAGEAARETARVARVQGVDLADERAVRRAREVATTTASNRSSMYQDVLAGRRTEIDAISGHVVSRSDSDTSVPVTRTLTALLRGWEFGRDLR
ncbi:MAG: ketopantoate reductase family protein [Salinirussus sp.]